MFNACKLLGRDFHASQYRSRYLLCELVLTRHSFEEQEISHRMVCSSTSLSAHGNKLLLPRTSSPRLPQDRRIPKVCPYKFPALLRQEVPDKH